MHEKLLVDKSEAKSVFSLEQLFRHLLPRGKILGKHILMGSFLNIRIAEVYYFLENQGGSELRHSCTDVRQCFMVS